MALQKPQKRRLIGMISPPVLRKIHIRRGNASCSSTLEPSAARPSGRTQGTREFKMKMTHKILFATLLGASGFASSASAASARIVCNDYGHCWRVGEYYDQRQEYRPDDWWWRRHHMQERRDHWRGGDENGD
jgi:hypothetical protein